MAVDHSTHAVGDDRLFDTLVHLHGIASPELRPALDRAASLVAEALAADTVDIFLHEAASDSLVALGTSATPMGRMQHELGLDRMPLANGGRAVAVYLTGEPCLQQRADEDPKELQGIIEGLGVRSGITTPLDVGQQRRGVVQAASAEWDLFCERDLRFLGAVAGWVGMLTHRAELSEELARQARRQGNREAGDDLARLTRRQQEVAASVAEGLTNEQIAQRLVLSPGTVANHIESILRRLDLRGRTQVGVWAVERGLYRSDTTRNQEEDGFGQPRAFCIEVDGQAV
jgi:DNA-binding CsgD family transcriptional regulator